MNSTTWRQKNKASDAEELPRYTLYLVDEADDERENVLAAKVTSAELVESLPDGLDDEFFIPDNKFIMQRDRIVKLVIKLRVGDDGVAFRVTSFEREDD